jgi:hypothetical protein
MQRTQLVIAFLLGAVVALGTALVVTVGRPSLPEAYAQTAGNNEMLLTTTTDQSNQNNTLFVIDSKNMRLAVYKLNGGRLSLMAVRQITYDMKLYDNPTFPGQGPSVSEIQKAAQDNDNAGKGKGH